MHLAGSVTMRQEKYLSLLLKIYEKEGDQKSHDD